MTRTALRRRALLASVFGLAPMRAPAAPARVATPRERQPRPQRQRQEEVFGHNAAVMRFADAVAERHGLDATRLRRQLAQARRLSAVKQLMLPPPPGTAKNWQAYRDRFVEPQRIGAGVVFWRDHEAWLESAEARYGVPPEIVVAIIGVETFYGRITGNFRVIDALATLAFDFPRGRSDRSEFFRDELEQFLLWCEREGRDAIEPLGSFAGAIGLPQFMPGSINRYGVDFDGDGHIDLQGNGADAVGSVAHFLAEHGWQRGMPTHFDVQPPAAEAARAQLLAPDILPSFSAAQFVASGARLDGPAQAHDGPLALVALENGGASMSYVAGTANFYTLTRYNRSSYYAMAVIALADALRRAR